MKDLHDINIDPAEGRVQGVLNEKEMDVLRVVEKDRKALQVLQANDVMIVMK